MKVLHVPFCYFPDPVGGTEVYVQSLAAEQQRQGVDTLIAAPAKRNGRYTIHGLQVCRFEVAQEIADVGEMYGEGDPLAAQGFGEILTRELPDVLHLHAFTRGVSLLLVREAKRRGIPVVFSYHTPTVSCQRGTLLKWGSEVCHGILDVTECARCTLHGHGVSKIGSTIAAGIPSRLGRFLGGMRLSGGVWTAARMTELIRVRQDKFRSLMAEVDHVIALCQWVKDLLLRNHVPEKKITVSRQGLDDLPAQLSGQSRPAVPIRVAFLGRLDPTKGVDILIQALKLNPRLDVRLDIFGVVQQGAGETYLRNLQDLAKGDARITFQPPISSDEVISKLRDYDLLAVPSQWLETGPRVVLEAFAAGIPVIGSNLGGIAELIRHNVDGLLVEPDSVDEWAGALRSIVEDPGLLESLRSGIRPPRSVREVAAETQEVYSALARFAPPLPA